MGLCRGGEREWKEVESNTEKGTSAALKYELPMRVFIQDLNWRALPTPSYAKICIKGPAILTTFRNYVRPRRELGRKYDTVYPHMH